MEHAEGRRSAGTARKKGGVFLATRISGTLYGGCRTDGPAVADAAVTLLRMADGVREEAVTDSTGRYCFSVKTRGRYRIFATGTHHHDAPPGAVLTVTVANDECDDCGIRCPDCAVIRQDLCSSLPAHRCAAALTGAITASAQAGAALASILSAQRMLCADGGCPLPMLGAVSHLSDAQLQTLRLCIGPLYLSDRPPAPIMKGMDRNMGMPVITASNTPRAQAITDIIESVALQETALAHILNAEGEKLQRIICTHNATPGQLLDFNKSVEQTIRSITQLEVILQGKLQLFRDCLCPVDGDDDDDDHGHCPRRCGC